ncbi:MAG: diguanylate cyclase [Desulfobacteraceae bacterium]|nr:diguanylate cyclase [Desulfobacteraceae bacterium]
MRVLIAEDDPIARMVLEERLIKWGYKVIITEDGTQAMNILEADNPPRLAILDWMMPGLDGLQICRSIRKHTERPYIYIILLTTRNQKDDLFEAMEAGADDFIAKPPDQNELKVRLRVGKRIIKLQKKLRRQTTHDFLTDLLSRFAIMSLLSQEMNRARRSIKPLSVAMADIDYFKKINDCHGHQVGDVVLCEVAKRMELTLRSYDSVGRYGGEEFLLVFPDCDQKEALIIAEKVRLAICNEPIIVGTEKIIVTMSIGITTMDMSKAQGLDDIIKIADMALYTAKANGRNLTEFIKI